MSNSSDTSTRSLVKIHNDHASATGTTTLEVINDSTGAALKVTGDMTLSGKVASTFDVGVDDTGYDVTFYGS